MNATTIKYILLILFVFHVPKKLCYAVESAYLAQNNYPIQSLSSNYSNSEQVFFYEWDGTWVIQYQLIQEFNEVQKLRKKQKNSWSSELMDFRNNSRETYFYNDTNMLITVVVEEWNSSSFKWDSSTTTSYTYNSKNLITEELIQQYDLQQKKWLKHTQKQYEYLFNDTILIDVYQSSWNTDSLTWENKKYTHYDYEEYSVLQTYFDWNLVKQDWENSYNIQKFHSDDNELLLYSLTKRWNQELSDWENSQKDTFNYNDSNNSTDYISYLWDNTEAEWYINQYSTYTYNEKGLIIEKIDSYYDLLLDDVIQTEKCEYTYKDSVWQETIIYAWNQNTSTWIESAMHANYFISPFPPASRNNKNNIDTQVKVFPNPFTDKLYIKDFENGEYVIYDIKGDVIQQGRINGNSSNVNIGSLLSGIYIVKLQSENHLIFQKIIKSGN